MTTRKFSTVRRRVAGYCLPVVALAVLAAPGLAWGQTGDCNATSNIAKNPFKVYALGETVSVRYTFGAGTLSPGLSLTVNDATTYVALDCDTALSGTNRENCLGFNGVPAADAADDGDAITYAGNLTFGNVDAGDACSGLTFTAVNHGDGAPPEADPNVLVFEADGPIVFDEGESCFIQFDAVVNGIGLPPNWDVGNQIVNAAAGFTGACGPALGASSTQSTAYEVEVTPEIDLKKEVSIDGGATWFDANDPPYPVGLVPTTTALYRLIVENTGEEPLTNVVINDDTPPLNLGLVNVPLPADCLDASGFFPVGVPCIIESGDSGFGGLGNPPVQVCLTEGPKTNLACTDGEGAASGGPVNACDPATVVCLEPGIMVTKDGPPLAKVGDEITYEICATNNGGLDLENCMLSDTLLGGPTAFAALLVPGQQECNSYPHTILPGGPDPLPNTATVTCDVVGFAAQVSDNDNHDVNLFQPAITVTKNGEAEGKVGDEVCYDIWFDNESSADTPPLVNCTGIDTVLGDLGVFTDGVSRNFCHTILPTDPNPLMNTATITCELDGWDNGLPAPASDNHSVDLFEAGAALTKSCATESIFVPDPISWEICVENTGDKAIDCTINDPTADITGVNVSVPAGNTDCTTTGSRPTTSDDVPSVTNTATAVCTVPGYDNELPPYTATDTCQVNEPGIEVTKDGPPLAKVGDEITYEICATNTGSVDLENCMLDDTLLGGPTPFEPLLIPGQLECNNYPYTVQPGDSDPLPNTATVTCDVVGAASTVTDNDNHDVNLFQPSITVTKNGDAEGKVGDEVCYDIWYDNGSSADTPPLTCTGTDTLLGPLGEFVDGVIKQFCRDIESGDPDPLPNTATITCIVDGWDNGLPAPASDNHNVDLFTVGATLDKACRPDPVAIGETVYWDITVNNTGEKAITCDVTDPDAGIIAPVVLNVPAGASATIDPPPSKIVEAGDVPTVDNTATANCTVDGYDNLIGPLTASDSCEVPPDVEEICRTPGFWKSHAGVEKEGRSTNLTQAVIDYNGGTLGYICGVEITDTSTNNYVGTGYGTSNGAESAVEGMCVHPKQQIIRQLQRQLIAASLNCVVSGGGADCTGISVEDDWKDANADCAANTGNLSDWIDIIDDFNNGVGTTCHDRNLKESDVFADADYKVPGPAGSSRACSAATSNDFYLVPLP